MTTTVKIDAHLSSDKEVLITLSNKDEVVKEIKIQNGESFTDYVHGDLAISVKEIIKDTPDILESDNGIISAALAVYLNQLAAFSSPNKLHDRVSELQCIFRDKDATQRYE